MKKMQSLELKFYWNGSFVGHTYHMEVNGVDVELGLNPLSISEDDAKESIIKILKESYNIEYDKNDIVFEFGGKL